MPTLKSTILIIFSILTLPVLCQNKKQAKANNKIFGVPPIATTYCLVKKECSCNGYGGYQYRISYTQPHFNDEMYCDYSNDAIIRASDSLKIALIFDLLKAAKDTTLCCKPVKKYSKSSNLPVPQSRRYTLQIDALYTINFIAFGVNAVKYSPYPVLYDTASGKEINYNNTGLFEVIKIYEDWYKEQSAKGFKNYGFPLSGSGYKWFATTERDIIMSEMPGHPSIDNLGRPQ